MGFGGLAPLPMRLGDGGEESVSPEQWLRVASDVKASFGALLVLLIQEPAQGVGNDGPCTVSGFGMGGSDLTGITVTRTTSGAVNIIDIDIGAGYTDPTLDVVRHWAIKAGHAKMVGYYAAGHLDSLLHNSGNLASVAYFPDAGTTGLHTVVLWGMTEKDELADYGAEPDKAASAYEGDVPYAHIWLTELRNVRGSAYSTIEGSFPEMENRAKARFFAFLQRCAERHVWAQLPACADENIGRWSRIMDVGTTNDLGWQARRKCAARFALIAGGPTEASMTEALQLILGPSFVALHTFHGTFDAPPDPTYWPGVNDGPGSMDLDGTGAWSSQRHHFVVQLTAPNDTQKARVLNTAHRDADELFFAALVPVSTWDYAFNEPGQFILGVSQLGRDSL